LCTIINALIFVYINSQSQFTIMQDIFEKIKSAVLSDEIMTLDTFKFFKSELHTITHAIQNAGYSLQQKQQKDCPFKIGDKVVYSAQFGPAVSKDPFLHFKLKGSAKKGDAMSVTWVDNKGETRTDKTDIK